MTFPSGTLLAQSVLSGIFIGSLYGLLGLGLGLAWGLLHIINLAHFGFAFLAAYLCYQLASVGGMDPLLDAIAFSRGRFAVSMPGSPALVMPAGTEIAHVVEDCRA